MEARPTEVRDKSLGLGSPYALLAMVSHELRTPLSNIIGLTELLRDTSLSSEQREYVKIVSDSSEALLRVVNDLLDYSHLESGTLSLATAEFDLERLVRGATQLLTHQASSKGVQLLTAIAPGVPRVLVGDPDRLRQVLVNLVGNAVKFTAQGKVVVRCTQQSRTDDAAVLRFEVSDTGIGISEEAIGRLFRPFAQADRSIAPRYGGIGLGLNISKRLVEMMGGRIGVWSTEGKGSTFWFTVVLGTPTSTLMAPRGEANQQTLEQPERSVA